MAQVERRVDGPAVLEQLIQWRLEHRSDHDLRETIDAFLAERVTAQQFQALLGDEYGPEDVRDFSQQLLSSDSGVQKSPASAASVKSHQPGMRNLTEAESILCSAPELPDEVEKTWGLNPMWFLYRLDEYVRAMSIDYLSIPRILLIALLGGLCYLPFYVDPTLAKKITSGFSADASVAGADQDNEEEAERQPSDLIVTPDELAEADDGEWSLGKPLPEDDQSDKLLEGEASEAQGALENLEDFTPFSLGGDSASLETEQSKASADDVTVGDAKPSPEPVETTNVSTTIPLPVSKSNFGQQLPRQSVTKALQLAKWDGALRILRSPEIERSEHVSDLEILVQAETVMASDIPVDEVTTRTETCLWLIKKDFGSRNTIRDMALTRLFLKMSQAELAEVSSRLKDGVRTRDRVRFDAWLAASQLLREDRHIEVLQSELDDASETAFCDAIFLASLQFKSGKKQLGLQTMFRAQRDLEDYYLDQFDELESTLAKRSQGALREAIEFFISKIAN